MTKDSVPSTATDTTEFRAAAAGFNRRVIDEFRANGGRVGAPFEGAALVLLTTIGARSGEEHITPLAFVRDGERLLVVASAGGAPRHPAWYHNLLAHPLVQVETGIEEYGAIAVPAGGEERDRLFARVLREQPGFADYQAGTDRPLPVVKLERAYVEAGPDEIATVADKLVEIHTWLRGQLRNVEREADTYFAERAAGQDAGPPVDGRSAAPPAPSLGLQLRQYCLAFCEALHFHHAGEDAAILPDLERYHPELRDVVERLRTEHRTVARLTDELRELLTDIASADPDRFRSALARMSAKMDAHLRFEEESLIPYLAEIPMPPHPGTAGVGSG